MKWTVIWRPPTEDELADLWTGVAMLAIEMPFLTRQTLSIAFSGLLLIPLANRAPATPEF